MNRIKAKFDDLRAKSTKGFIPFITAGDPDIETSLLICQKLADLGADVIEFGVPFSDPMADGPTIQRSSMRSLENGTTLSDVLMMAKRFRGSRDTPVVIFTYFNPVLRFGIDRFARTASEAGIDGVLLTDVIGDEADEVSQKLTEYGIDLISLAAPTTTDERLHTICANARGFIYAVSRAGVTGARVEMAANAEELCRRIRNFTDLPIAVGFGISTMQHVESVWQYGDAAVVGSAIVAEIEASPSPLDALKSVEAIVTHLLPQRS